MTFQEPMFIPPFEIPLERVNALVELANNCNTLGVRIKAVRIFQCGFHITFYDCPKGSDAVCHEFSYGHESGYFETIGFPWDHGDVSIHEPAELAKLIAELVKGE